MHATSSKLPAFDYTALVASACEMRSLATPTKIEAATQADAYTLVLTLRGLEGKLALHVSWHPEHARVCLGPAAPRVHKSEQLSFGEQCQANLRGLVLTAVHLPEPWERVAVFSFAERPGTPAAFTMRCEVMGRHSNAFLVDAAGTMVACAYQVGAAQTSVRPMSPGFKYAPPPPAPGIPPTAAASLAEWRETVTAATAMLAEATAAAPPGKNKRRVAKASRGGPPGVEKGMVRAFRGVSPSLAGTLALGAGVPSGIGPAALDDAAWGALHNEWIAWVTAVDAAFAAVADDEQGIEPGSSVTPAAREALERAGWCAARGQLLLHVPAAGAGAGGVHAPDVYAPLSPASKAADPSGAGGPVGALFAATYGGASDADVFRRERERLLQGVRAASKKIAQKTAAFRRQIDDAAHHEAVKIRADEIMAYQHGWKEGTASLEVYDFETGEPRDVDVDPVKGPMATAEALYKKARKQRRTAGSVAPLLAAAEEEAEYLGQVEFALSELTGPGGDGARAGGGEERGGDLLALEEIANELVEAKLMAPIGKGAAARIRQDERAKQGKKKAGGGGARGGKKARRENMMANIRTYVAPSGREVLVGRNSKGNEAVSLTIGQDHDVWFHVRGAPGAHVILRLQPGEAATEADMKCAADLAAFHSKLRTGGKVDVSWTSPKFVRKPSGGRLGMVTIDQESVMTGRPDDSEAAAQEARETAVRGAKNKAGGGSW